MKRVDMANYAHLHISEPFLEETIEAICQRIVEDGGEPLIHRDEYGVQITGVFSLPERKKKMNKTHT